MDVLALPVQEADARWVADWSKALDAEERARADRFRRDADRRCYIAAHALLRTALGAATGRSPGSVVLVSGAHGKPFMPDAPGLHFSLTHTAGLTAVALHTCEVGCDAERADRQVAETVFSMLAREERAWLRALDPGPARQRAFIRLWVVKEAFAKALGLGLSLDPRTYAFDLSDGSARLSRAPPGHTDSNWGFVARTVGSAHVLALAVRGILGSAEMEIPRLVAAGEIARAAAGGPPFGMS